jgi:hypothetical protein
MSQAVVTLQLPEEVFERVRRAAKGVKQPVETALVNIVKAATPSLDKVPDGYRAELEALEDLGDDELWQMANSVLAPTQQRRLADLLEKNQRGAIEAREQRALSALRAAADRLMLRRSYAYLLLKYRGHRIPSLADRKQ